MGVYKNLFLLLFCALIFTANAVANPQADEIFSQGRILEKHLEIFKAGAHFKTAIEMDSQNEGYLTHYGWFLTAHGFYEEAAEVFERLLPMASDKTSILLGLGWSLQEVGRLEKSLKAFGQVFSITSSDLKPAFEEIRQRLSRNNAEKIKNLKSRLESATDQTALQYELLKTYIDQGELDNAIELAKSLHAQDRLNLQMRLWYARALFWKGEIQQAESEYRALIKQSPQSAFLHLELAKVLDSEERYAEAQTILETSLELFPSAAVTRKKLAEILTKSDHPQQAEKMAKTIEPQGANRLNGLMAMARVFHFSGQLEAAQPIYKTVLAEYPYHQDALWGMMETSIYTGRYQAALQTMRRWESTIPDNRLKAQQRLFDLYFAPRAAAKADYYSNSSDFTRNNIGAEFSMYTGWNIRLDSGYHFSRFSQDGFESINRHSVFVQAEKALSKELRLDGRLVSNFYDNDNSELNGKLSANLQLSPKFSTQAHFRHFDIIDTMRPFENAVYNHVVTIGAVGLGITSDELGLGFCWQPASRFTFLGEAIHGEYSDDNTKHSLLLEAGYQLTTQPHLRVAYNYFYLDFEDAAPTFGEGAKVEAAYFDPINFESHSLRLEYRKNHNNAFSYGAESAISFIPQNNGLPYLISAFTQWHIKESFRLRFDARWFYQNKGIDRVGETGEFWANHVVAVIEYRF